MLLDQQKHKVCPEFPEQATEPAPVSSMHPKDPQEPSRQSIGTLLKNEKSSPATPKTNVHAAEWGMKPSLPQEKVTAHTIRTEADQVVALMRANIATMLERGDSVARLSEKSEQLQAQAYRFRVHAQKTERNLWWRNMRMNIAIAILSMLAIGIVISLLLRGSSPTTNTIQKSLSQDVFPVYKMPQLETTQSTLDQQAQQASGMLKKQVN